MTPKDVGETFNIEFTIPKAEIAVKCRCVVIWNRMYSKTSRHEPGMGLRFEDLDYAVSDKIEAWVIEQQENEAR